MVRWLFPTWLKNKVLIVNPIATVITTAAMKIIILEKIRVVPPPLIRDIGLKFWFFDEEHNDAIRKLPPDLLFEIHNVPWKYGHSLPRPYEHTLSFFIRNVCKIYHKRFLIFCQFYHNCFLRCFLIFRHPYDYEYIFYFLNYILSHRIKWIS